MRVMICDDEKAPAIYLQELLLKQKDIEIQGIFQGQEELWQHLSEESLPDVVFMDIDWKEKQSGIMLAKKMFEKYPSVQIIYVTGYNDRFSQHIFLEDANLCGYLVKPVQEELLVEILSKAQKRRNVSEDKFIVKQRGTIQAFANKEILCFESKGHHVFIHTKDAIVQIYEKLDECERKLPRQFARCHKSYVVNMDNIVYIDKNEIQLKGIKKVPISKSKYQEFRENYFKYMGENI